MSFLMQVVITAFFKRNLMQNKACLEQQEIYHIKQRHDARLANRMQHNITASVTLDGRVGSLDSARRDFTTFK